MARLSYSAPGVYVEEIASARQPISGVGTNTVAFIGLVPDRIYYPVANPQYDPVSARAVLAMTAPGQAGATSAQDAQAEVKARIASLNQELEHLKADLETARQAVTQKTADRDQARTAAAAAPEDQVAARKAKSADRALQDAAGTQADLESQVQQKTADLATLNTAATAAPAPAPGAAPAAAPAGGAPAPKAAKAFQETEDDEYADGAVDQALASPSLVRPYYLKPFDVAAAPLATKLCTNFTEYTRLFGDFSAFSDKPLNPDDDPELWRYAPLFPGHHMLTHAVKGFFDNGGTKCFVARIKDLADIDDVLDRLESIEEVAILAAPGLPKVKDVWASLETYCEDDAHQNVFAILDCPGVVNDGTDNDLDVTQLSYDVAEPKMPPLSTHAACYFPYIEVMDKAKRLQDEDPARGVPAKYRGLAYVAPSGHMAGVYARIDEERGVHKAPANAVLRGALEVKYYVSKPKQELLNPQGVNALRIMDGNVVVWGARTVGGARNGDYRYVSVRRFIGFLEESIQQGTQWVVFEPNDASLWSKIRLNVTAFLTNCWRSGALFGLTAEQAFYVKCDEELNPKEVRDLGQVICEIGVAVVTPAEFVIFRIAQTAGDVKG